MELGSLSALRQAQDPRSALRLASLAQDPSKGADLLIDARSQEYVRLIRAPASAISLRVVSEGADGRRLAISHWNKLHKGVLARALVRDRPRVSTLPGLISWAERSGIRLERVGAQELDFVV